MEADDQFGAGVRVAAQEQNAFRVERRTGACQYLDQKFLGRRAVGRLGQGDQSLGETGRYAGGVEIGTGVDSGYAAHEPGVVREGGEGVQRGDDPVPGRRPVGDRVVRRRRVQDHLLAGFRGSVQTCPRQSSAQPVGSDLCRAAAAEHGSRPRLSVRTMRFRAGLHGSERGQRRAVRVEGLEAFHEPAIDPVLEPHDPATFEGGAPLGAGGAAVAEVEQSQEVALRPVPPESLARVQAFQILDQVGPHAHCVDAGARPVRLVDQGRAVADGEDVVVALHLQSGAGACETAIAEGQVGAPEDRQRGGAGYPEGQIRVEASAVFEPHGARLDRGDRRLGQRQEPALAGRRLDSPGQRRMVAGQDAVARLYDRYVGFESQTAQPGVDAEGQFDAAGAAADDDHARLLAGQSLDPAGDRRRQTVDRPGGDRVLAHAGQLEAGHGRANVEGGDVERDRLAALDQQTPVRRFDAGAGRENDPDARPARQRHRVDLQFMPFVLAGHQSGRHAGVDGDRRVDDEGRLDGRVRVHHPVAEDLDVGVPGTDQDDLRHQCPSAVSAARTAPDASRPAIRSVP